MTIFGPISGFLKEILGIESRDIAELEIILRNEIKAAKKARLKSIREEVEIEVKKEMEFEIERRTAKRGTAEIVKLEAAEASFRDGYKSGLRVAFRGDKKSIEELLTWFSQLMTAIPTQFGFGIGYIEGLARRRPEIILRNKRGYAAVMNALRKPTHVEFRKYLLKRIEKNQELEDFCALVA